MIGLVLRFVRRMAAPWLALLAMLLVGSPAVAATCAAAASAGAAANGWDTYCWLDMSTYNDTTAKSAGGQVMTFNLGDGSVFNVTVKATSTTANAITAVAAPAWVGGAIGNTSFLGIPGKPIMYTTDNAANVVLKMSNMSITPPAGALAGSYMFIVADGESSNESESINYVTNGGNWSLLDLVPPISGAVFPPYALSGQTATVTGTPGTVGGQIFGSVSPTTVTTTMQAGGLQGVMFAVRFASIRLNKTIASSRLAAADQFTYSVKATSSGGVLASQTTSGAATGPFANAAASLASGISITLNEAMAAGSTSALTQYSGRLTCTNSNTGSPTVMPSNVVTTNYVLGSVAFGDAITCTFVNTPVPRVSLSKALSGSRVFVGDQFTVQINNGAATVASATTTGTGSTIATGTTGTIIVTPATAYTLTEVPSGTTNAVLYTGSMACTNAYASSTTTLPTTVGGTVTPTYGDNISCTLTNAPNSNKVIMAMAKTSAIISDPANGTTNPKAIPGAVIQYTLTVTNSGPGTIDTGTVILTDPLPASVIAYVSGTPVTFTNGTTPSGLTYSYPANVSWSKAAGGGAPYTYTPVPDANGYDPLVTGVRIAMTGSMAGATLTAQPSFSLGFLTKIR